MSTIRATWDHIERWLEANAPEVLRELEPAAPLVRIEKIEKRLGVTLPADYRESLLIHDGQRRQGNHFFGARHSLLPLAAIPGEWDALRALRADVSQLLEQSIEADPGVRSSWFRDGWIPIAAADARDVVCLDLDPAEGGTRGQLVQYFGDWERRERVASSFEEWLDRWATKLGAGQVRVRRAKDGFLIGFRDLTDLDADEDDEDDDDDDDDDEDAD